MTTFNPQESAERTCTNLEADCAWRCVQQTLADELGGDFAVNDVELTAVCTTRFSGPLDGVRLRLSLTVEFDSIDDGSQECRAGLIRGLRDYLDRVERR